MNSTLTPIKKLQAADISEKLTVAWSVKKLSRFYETHGCIIVFTWATPALNQNQVQPPNFSSDTF